MNHSFAKRPIPIADAPPTTSQTAGVGFDFNDERVSEDLLDIKAAGILGVNYYAIADGKNPPNNEPIRGAIRDLLARKGVVEKLIFVDNQLSLHGLALFVFDSYRPIETQLGIWSFFRRRVAADMRGASDTEIDERTRMFVSDPRTFDPKEPSTWPIHSTGGAVDLALADRKTGQLLKFGAAFDEMGEASFTDHLEKLLRAGTIDETNPGLVNRRILYWSMREAGFTNYPHEYWHYDFGDQMYVICLHALGIKGPSAAWYPSIDADLAAIRKQVG